jgi:hypothetical protein
MSFSKLDYCQYLFSSPINYTLTNLAEHLDNVSHDRINRYLRAEEITPSLLWDNVKHDIETCENAYIIFDDTVLDKRYAKAIELSRYQYSGNAHRVIRGIGIVTCLYVNANTGKFWIVDYRIYDKEGDGKKKPQHVMDMLNGLVEHKQLPFHTVLMDGWYASNKLMLFISDLDKIFYCPLKRNRLVDDSGGVEDYQRVDALNWSEPEIKAGKLIKIRKFPAYRKVRLFRVAVSNDRTDFVATNDLTQNDTDAVQEVHGTRWKIEQFHRELKQITGIQACQCRKARIQRNHIGCAMFVWAKLKQFAYQTGQTVYQLKQQLWANYLKQILRHPPIDFTFA